MKGKHKVIVKNNKLHYEFEIKRNITIVKGDSATGKTTLINMIRQFANQGNASGIDLVCDVPCRVLEGIDWRIILQNLSGNIIFIDEENSFIRTEEFASAVRNADNYFVLISRDNLCNLPYSVEEIYGLCSSGKYQNTKRIYQQMYQIYPQKERQEFPVRPERIVVEDSNSGYEFFHAVCLENQILCESAEGKTKIFSAVQDAEEEVCIIADGAAIGPEMEKLYNLAEQRKNINLYLPESFEWLLLNAGIIEDKEIKEILKEPEKYIESQEHFSWERYFTSLLVKKTKDNYLKYQKSRLNQVYLHERNKSMILECIKGIVIAKKD